MIDRSTTAPPPVLSPNSISPLLSSHRTCLCATKNSAIVQTFCFHFLLFLNFASLILHALELRESRSVCNNSRMQNLGVDQAWQASVCSGGRDGTITVKRIVARCVPVLTYKTCLPSVILFFACYALPHF